MSGAAEAESQKSKQMKEKKRTPKNANSRSAFKREYKWEEKRIKGSEFRLSRSPNFNSTPRKKPYNLSTIYTIK